MDGIREMIEKAAQSPGPVPIFRVGQKVRIRKTLRSNILGIEDVLGTMGKVESIQVSPIMRRLTYQVRVGPCRVEPFDEDELDSRFATRTTEAP